MAVPEVEIVTDRNDVRRYRYLVLDNSMKVLLISTDEGVLDAKHRGVQNTQERGSELMSCIHSGSGHGCSKQDHKHLKR